MKNFLIVILFFLTITSGFSQHENTPEGDRAIPFTLNDRDRIMRTEEQIKSLRNEMIALNNSLRNEMNAKFDSVNERIDTLYWILGIIIILVVFNLGYTMWDRRTALNPLREQTVDMSQKVETLINVLKEESKTNKRLAEIMQSFGLL